MKRDLIGLNFDWRILLNKRSRREIGAKKRLQEEETQPMDAEEVGSGQKIKVETEGGDSLPIDSNNE